MYDRVCDLICRSSLRHPLLWLLAAVILTIPALFQVRQVELNTDPVRLLPQRSTSAALTRKLDAAVGEHGFFYVMLWGEDRSRLIHALESAVETIGRMEEIQSIEYRNPVQFFTTYRYLLVPEEFLDQVSETFVRWQTEVGFMSSDLLGDEEREATFEERENRKYVTRLIELYGNLPFYHQSKDGKVMGMTLVPRTGLKDIKTAKRIHTELEEMAESLSQRYDVSVGIGGGLSRWVNGYSTVIADIRRSGLVMLTGILLVLLLAFRSLRVVPVLLFPLLIGLVWALGAIPTLVGDLNTITSFFLIVTFGLGIDFSIHLLMRYQRERRSRSPSEALFVTFQSTGKSVGISALTTALALFVLASSDFRGVSEFGIVGGGALMAILLSNSLFLPATLVVGERWALIPRSYLSRQRRCFPKTLVSFCFLLLVAGALILTGLRLEFDYDFSQLGGKINESPIVRERQDRVYPTSLPPAAVYVADDLPALDAMLSVLEDEKRAHRTTTIGWVRSIRDISPDDSHTKRRLETIEEIRKQAAGRWTERLEDPDRKRWLEDLLDWESPSRQPHLEEIPGALERVFSTHDGSGRHLIGVFPKIDRLNGRNAIAFTRELNALDLPDGVQGPIGETPVTAEILLLVTREGPWLVLWTFLGVFGLVLLYQRSFEQALWVTLPLAAGLILTSGLMSLLDIKINLYNIVVFPALLGMGVDDGVHFFRRWQDNEGRTRETFGELFPVLSVTTITTLLGYGGLTLAHHPGLNSLGVLACIGLMCTWATTLFLLPGLLKAVKDRNRSEPKSSSSS